jgi:hypothetical protein
VDISITNKLARVKLGAFQELVANYGATETARILSVHVSTVGKWVNDLTPPGGVAIPKDLSLDDDAPDICRKVVVAVTRLRELEGQSDDDIWPDGKAPRHSPFKDSCEFSVWAMRGEFIEPDPAVF